MAVESSVDATLDKNPLSAKAREAVASPISRYFTRRGADPFGAVKWESRDVAISGSKGEVVFEQKEVEVPDFYSQMAAGIIASKYFYGDPATGKREGSLRTLISRVVETLRAWGEKDRYFPDRDSSADFADELTHILLHQYAAFNSPVWFNVGVRENPQCSACFIVSVQDSLQSLLELQTTEAQLFKYGSGTGTNLSTLRASKEKLSGGGRPSGPVSFMRAFDAWAGVVKSGGKTRRAAKMQILNVDHPDILEFINAKRAEEQKAWALIDQGFDGNFGTIGGAYDSVAFQNVNTSVRVDDEFMRAAERGGSYHTHNVADGSRCQELNARDVLKLISECAHVCGDPGLQYDTTINHWHTCPKSGRINASNPCSEYMHLDDSACNLASINLLKYLDQQGEFEIEAFRHTVRVLITAQDILIDNSSYPTPKIADTAHRFRQLGLGYANLGALLMSLGLPYDSEAGREWAGAMGSIMSAEAYRTSAALAKCKGAFAGFKKNRADVLRVISQHSAAAEKHGWSSCTKLGEASKALWRDALELAKRDGVRNSQVSVLAPTGTISFMMDCDTTGIEPDIALIKYKKLVGGGYLKIVNNAVIRALQCLGYSDQQRKEIVEYIGDKGTIEGAPHVRSEHLAVFDCALRPAAGTRCISSMGHLKMMGAVQPFISGAISKTVNLPRETGAEEIFQIYLEAWRMGLKAVALYRDGSKRTQPLSTSKESSSTARGPKRKRLPDERKAITHKFSVSGLEGYLTVGLYEDGMPGEIFLVVAKEGSTLSGVMDAFATSISIALQYGVPLHDLCRKFTRLRFEPAGFTNNSDIPMASSVVDYVFRWMALHFLSKEQQLALGIAEKMEGAGETQGAKTGTNGHSKSEKKVANPSSAQAFQNWEDAPPCTACGSALMVRQGGCYVCLNCGTQGGCG